VVLSNGIIKQGARNEREDLAENAAYSIQGGAPSGCWISWQNSIATDRRRRLLVFSAPWRLARVVPLAQTHSYREFRR
jgi:hypothetical protein